MSAPPTCRTRCAVSPVTLASLLAMPDFTCTRCGETFSLRTDVLERYPGWTPQRCRACRDATGGGGAAASGRAGSGGARSGDTRGARSSRRRPRGRGREENLTLDEVLAKYDAGPTSGVFTDGSADPNPGPGGWGAVYVVDGEVIDQGHGADPATTNNRMELTALLHGFDLVPVGTQATVYTDSKLCVDTITSWAKGWEARGWTRKSGEIKNLDLVQALYAKAKSRPELTLEWIRAHDGSRWNEYADSLSTAYRRDVL